MLFKKKKEKCKYTLGGYKCSRPALPGDEHCFFHSDDIERKKDKFNEEFWKKEFKRQKKDEKEYDFTGFVFPENFPCAGKEFDKDAYFIEAHFSGGADFWTAHFSGRAHFVEAKFSGGAHFESAQFSGGASFRGAKFSGKASFVFAQFSGRCDFSEAEFSGRTYFGAAQFSGEADFWKAHFSGEAYFMEAQFSGKADFRGAEFHSKSFFRDVVFQDFNKCNMTDTSFYNVFDLLEFLAEYRKKIKHPRGIKYLHEDCKPILGETTISRLPILSREIKDDIYLMSFKEKHPKLQFIWWLFADCGRSFKRWAVWSIGFAFFFGLIYTPCFDFFPDWWIDLCNKIGPQFEQTSKAYSGQPIGFWSSLYFSIVTFTTLGFGDIVTANITARILVTIEVILGYIMLGGLISILANKLARRS